jgi:sugar lactone lactonase YvrE
MPIRSILFPVVPSILLAAVAGCAVEPGAVDDESVQRAASAAPVQHRPHVLVANSRGDNIVGYAEDGAPLGDFIPPGRDGLDDPDTMLIGPDHRLYVTSGAEPASSAVLRFDARTGAFLGVFASGHGLHRPYGLAFGADGLLYVASFMTDEIFRFDAATGAFVDVFSHGDGKPGGLNGPNSLVFGPDGGLYVTTEGSVAGEFPGLPSEVLRFDIATGAHSVFIAQPEPSPASLGFVSLLGLTFGPDCDCDCDRRHSCDLFVSDFANDVRRYDPATGELEHQLDTNYTGTQPSNNFTGGLSFDRRGRLFVAGFDHETEGNPGALLRFDSVHNRPLPAHGEPGALFVPPSPQLVRPIGVLALE